MLEQETELEFNGHRYLRVPVFARLRETTVDELPEFVHVEMPQAVGATTKQMYWQDKENPDLVWTNFILDSEGINKNFDYMPRSQLLASHHTAKFKPMDMDHVVKEEKSLVGMSKENPPTKNTIFGVMSDTALADSNGKLLTKKQIDDLEVEDDPEREVEDRVTVVAWAALYYFLFPKTVAQLVNVIKTGAMKVSMERWLKDWDFMVETAEGYEIHTRDEAAKNGVANKWITKQSYNGNPVVRRTIAYTYGGVASTSNPANSLSRFLEKHNPSSVKVAASLDDPVLAELHRRHNELVDAFAISESDDERLVLQQRHAGIHRAVAAYLG